MASATEPVAGVLLFGTLGVILLLLTIRWASQHFWTAILIILAVRPGLDYFNSKDGRGIDAPALLVGLVFLCASAHWLFRRARRGTSVISSRSTLALVGFASLCVVSSLTSDSPLVSFQAAIRVISTAMMLIVLEQVLRDRPDRLTGLLVAVFASIAAPAVAAALQLQGSVPEVPLYGLAIDVGRIRGTFVHPNPFATYLTMLLPLAAALLPHVRHVARLGVAVICATSGWLLFFTYARGAWFAGLIGVLVVGWLQDRRVIWVVLGSCIVVLLAVPSAGSRLGDLGDDTGPVAAAPDSLSWRIGYWQEVLPLTLEGPITGVGLNVVESRTADGLPPHNVLVQALVETGVAGLATLLIFLATVTRDLRNSLRVTSSGLNRGVRVGAAAVFAAFVVQCTSENLLSQPVVQWYLCVPLAWALSSCPPWPLSQPEANSDEDAY